jgi:hypothetical protein
MTLTCDWVLVCEEAFFDPQRPQSLCVSRIIEQAVVDTLPCTLGPFLIVAHLAGFGERVQVGLRATRPDGTFIVVNEDQLSFEHVGPYLLFTISRFEAPTEGRYRFDIVLDGVHVARTASLAIMRVSHDVAGVVH